MEIISLGASGRSASRTLNKVKCAYLPVLYGSEYLYSKAKDGIYNCSDEQLRQLVSEGKFKKVKNLAGNNVDVLKYGITDSNARNVDAVIIGMSRRAKTAAYPVWVSAGWLKRHAEMFLENDEKRYTNLISSAGYLNVKENNIREDVEEFKSKVSELNDDAKVYISWFSNGRYHDKLTDFSKKVCEEGDLYSIDVYRWNSIVSNFMLICFAFDSGEDEDMYIKKKRVYFHSEYSDKMLYSGDFNFDGLKVPIITVKQFVRVMNESNETTLDASIIASFNEADEQTKKILSSVVCNSNLNDPVTLGIVAYLCWEHNLEYYCSKADEQILDEKDLTRIYNAESYFDVIKNNNGEAPDEILEILANEAASEITSSIMSNLVSESGMNKALLGKICGKLGVVDYTAITIKELKKHE